MYLFNVHDSRTAQQPQPITAISGDDQHLHKGPRSKWSVSLCGSAPSGLSSGLVPGNVTGNLQEVTCCLQVVLAVVYILQGSNWSRLRARILSGGHVYGSVWDIFPDRHWVVNCKQVHSSFLGIDQQLFER